MKVRHDAVAAAAAANIVFGINDVWLRLIANDIGLIQAHWLRSVFFFAIVLVVYRPDFRSIRALGVVTPLQIARGVLPVLASLAWLASMAQLPAAEATALVLIGPALTTLIAPLLLGERASVFRMSVASAGLCGMLLIVRPGFGAFGAGHLLALASALLFSFYQLATRKVSTGSDPRVSMFVLAVVAVVFTTPAAAFVWKPLTPAQLLAPAMSAILYCAGQILLVYGYARAEATLLSPSTYCLLIGVTIGGYVMLRDIATTTTVVGCTAIALATAAPSFLSWFEPGRGQRAELRRIKKLKNRD